MLPKVNKNNMAGTMKSIEEYLRSHHGVIRASLAYIVRKNITVHIYGDYPKYVSLDDEMITRILHLHPNENKLHNEQSAQSVTECTVELKIVNKSVYDILDQTCKDNNLYPYVKSHKSKRVGRRAYYAIYSRWLGLNQVNATASEAKMALQTSTYNSKKKAWNWESMLPNMSSNILSWENIWNMGAEALIQDLRFNTC